MDVWYVRYDSDDPIEEGIWLEPATEFFVKKEDAEASCESMNATGLTIHGTQKQKALEKWEMTEAAFIALSAVDNLDPHSILPYHRKEFMYAPYNPTYVVDRIEVTD